MNNNNELRFVATTSFEGGAEKYIASLAELFAAAKHPVRLLGDLRTWPGGLPHCSLGAGPKWSLRTLPLGLWRLIGELRTLRKSTAGLGPGVYHLHFKREQIGFSKHLSSLGRVVWTEHGRFPTGPFGLIIRPFYRHASKRVSTVVCVSDIVARDIARFVADPAVIEVIDTAVDLSKYSVPTEEFRQRVRRELGLDDRPVAVYVGRIEPNKRPALAIRGALEAGAQVLVAGSGSQLLHLADVFGSEEDVHFLGQLDNASHIFAVGDVHIFSSTGAGEGFPTVIIESAACGLPTVATADAGFGKAVESAGGYSCEPTAGDVAAAVKEILADLPPRRVAARNWAESRDQATWRDHYGRVLFGAAGR
ncbi:glycosyltransferase family 4 protein [Arthrobacter sp. ISL-5]|uniref:glycosyltransferase family 4 protein n=1 Tax=Arthrobacter sp. ISL-5 TaxID=2819111 RepID=UPI001BE95A9F|nr:glycosyltransferase family 4 protein [Arthrobacter sp. ISL-5]MBT2552815.1 glycosyltransferase family 4 protein [Arthrobacter sp. ISL-5]